MLQVIAISLGASVGALSRRVNEIGSKNRTELWADKNAGAPLLGTLQVSSFGANVLPGPRHKG